MTPQAWRNLLKKASSEISANCKFTWKLKAQLKATGLDDELAERRYGRGGFAFDLNAAWPSIWRWFSTRLRAGELIRGDAQRRRPLGFFHLASSSKFESSSQPLSVFTAVDHKVTGSR
jgi:hypothetical protein